MNVNPKKAYPRVFVFPITKGLARERGDAYEATRKYWRGLGALQDSVGAYAVGLTGGTCVSVFKIERWQPTECADERGRYEFTGQAVHDSELLNTDWSAIRDAALGYWQYGNWFVVEFDGAGRFRVLRGSADKSWHSC